MKTAIVEDDLFAQDGSIRLDSVACGRSYVVCGSVEQVMPSGRIRSRQQILSKPFKASSREQASAFAGSFARHLGIVCWVEEAQ
jgi:hypothetical protein